MDEEPRVARATGKPRDVARGRREVSEMTGHVSFRGTGSTLGDNVGLVAALIAVVVAQVLKPFSEWAITGRFKASLMVGSGGFPSSHSSLVTALATGTACQAGLGDPAFATALVLALVVRPPSVNTLILFTVAIRPFARDARQTPTERRFDRDIVTGDVRRHGGAKAGWYARHRHQQPGHGVPFGP